MNRDLKEKGLRPEAGLANFSSPSTYEPRPEREGIKTSQMRESRPAPGYEPRPEREEIKTPARANLDLEIAL